MSRILTALLAFHWMAVFALAASGRVGAEGASEQLATLAVAVVYALVAVLFLWTLVSAFVEEGEPGGLGDIARLALGGAVAALTFDLILQGVSPVSREAVPFAVQLAALMGSYLVIHVDRRDWHRKAYVRTNGGNGVNATARLMALGAAHRTMLGRGVPRFVPANDERRR